MTKTMMVTGASKGIGQATVERFWATKNDLDTFVLLARKSTEFDELREHLMAENPWGKRFFHHEIDLNELDEIRALLPKVMGEVGSIEYLINNAGYTLPAPIHEVRFEDFERTMHVNLYAPFVLTQGLLHAGNRFEFILNIASTAGINGRSGWLTYSASKAAMIAMSQVMKEELSIYGTRVVTISPGRCATALRRTLAPDEDPSTIMQPEDVAGVIELLASDHGRFVDSQNLVVRL
ncbi:SDR family NAD(P)-dependent oxidoreductase [Propionicimonas sp.]|uniref:SDR family NAD(P)-dependent oxidoreductase n=1 Tax=Propionicimonas sp. TaxID=1955623 RepID=UPI0025FE3AF5|nr:SDR family oxidoreductase [Propionicimonas sp.]MCG2803992.1 SDR family oxidoreductase [Propionicimonas sp.]